MKDAGRNLEVHPGQHRMGAEGLVYVLEAEPVTRHHRVDGWVGARSALHGTAEVAGRRLAADHGGLRVARSGQAVEAAAEHVARHGGDRDHHERERGRLAVGEVLLVRPELGGERLRVGRDEHRVAVSSVTAGGRRGRTPRRGPGRRGAA